MNKWRIINGLISTNIDQVVDNLQMESSLIAEEQLTTEEMNAMAWEQDQREQEYWDLQYGQEGI